MGLSETDGDEILVEVDAETPGEKETNLLTSPFAIGSSDINFSGTVETKIHTIISSGSRRGTTT